jgi:hypothetical protein
MVTIARKATPPGSKAKSGLTGLQVLQGVGSRWWSLQSQCSIECPATQNKENVIQAQLSTCSLFILSISVHSASPFGQPTSASSQPWQPRLVHPVPSQQRKYQAPPSSSLNLFTRRLPDRTLYTCLRPGYDDNTRSAKPASVPDPPRIHTAICMSPTIDPP